MKYFIKYTLFVVGITVALTACDGQTDSLTQDRLDENQPPDQTVNADAGEADFSNFVAIGNSLMAGTMDGALYDLSQQNSIPALMAEQLKTVGAPEDFNQPDINSKRGFNESATPSGGPVLGRFKLDADAQAPSPTLGGEKPAGYSGDTNKLDNFGVPGILLGQLLTPATGGPQQGNLAFNPYYARFASAPGSSKIIDDVLASQPTFFTLWIGNNDVLGYATGGAADQSILTGNTAFQGQYNSVVNALMNNSNAKGVVINIPPFLGLPFFRAVPYNAVELGDAEAQQLNQALAPVNAALDAVAANFPNRTQADMDARKVHYEKGANPILVNDPSMDRLNNEFDQLEAAGAITAEQRQKLIPYEQSRPLTKVNGNPELVTLPAGSVLGTEANPQSQRPTTIGVIVPLGLSAAAGGDEYYLTLQEQQQIETKRATFNGYIKAAVNAHGNRLALYNTNNPNGAFSDIFGAKPGDSPGVTVGGVDLAPDFTPNGVISLDGVHPNPRGSGVLANEILGAIEDKFNSTIPKTDVLKLPSVQTCNNDCVSQQ